MIETNIAWAVALVAGSVVAKMLALFMRGRDLGLVLGPIVGAAGGAVVWQAYLLATAAKSSDPVLAGVIAFIGGGAAFITVAMLKRPS